MSYNDSNIDQLVNDIMTERVIVDDVGFYRSSYSIHEPYERQQLFLDLRDEKEAFYGGAAGGGKSDALLMAALEYVHVPGYAALLLRKTYVDLARPEAIMDRAHKWLKGTDAQWSDKHKTYTFPSGATLTFGYLESENDKYQYQSSEFQFIGFDELSQFTETQYTYLFSRLRRKTNVPVPLRMRSGSNPGGIGGNWVKARFIPEDFTPDMAEEAKVWSKQYVDEETGKTKTRYFVPARLDDNPYLDQEAYDDSLSELDPVTRAQLRRGDWSITAKGDILYDWDERYIIVPWSRFMAVFGLTDKRIPAHWRIGIFQDWGTTKDHPCVTGWFATASENSPTIDGVSLAGMVFWYRTHIKTKCSAKEIKDDIVNYMRPENELYRCNTWEMSHEASSERLEYNKEDDETEISLPFTNWQTGKTRGLESLKSAIKPIELNKPHPFNLGIMGHTKLVILVDDAQYISPKVMMDGLDAGQSRIRAEAPVYRWLTPKSGEPPKKLEPYAFFNDAIDLCRSAAASYWPVKEELTRREILAKELKKTLPFLQENVDYDQTELRAGSQIAIAIESARIRKKLKKDYGSDFFDDNDVIDLCDISDGW